MKSQFTTIFILIVAGFCLLNAGSNADLFRDRTVEAVQLDGTPIKIDGKLSESVWVNAKREGQFFQRSPEDGEQPTNETYFSIFYDEDYLYFGIWVNDNDPANIDAILTRRDEDSPSDWVYVSIDSYNDNRTAFEFGLNAAGVKQDLRRFDDDNIDFDWDSVWDGKVSRTQNGWTAEFQIPFRELRFNTSETMSWGLMVYREYPRNSNEFSVWNYWSKDDAGFVSNYGTLTGLNNIKSENPIYIIPYVVGKDHINNGLVTSIHPEKYDLSSDAGADIRFSFENGLTVNATINPDFGQVEADPAEFNLTAFESYFSEKRPFFIEGGNILRYSMGFGDGDNSNNTLFYSRRIGRTPHDWVGTNDDMISVENPDYTNIISAVKLTGKTRDGLSIGVMDALTDKEEAVIHNVDGSTDHSTVEPMTNFFISRLQQDFRDGQTVFGGILTATNRDLKNTGMDYLHKSAYTGGFDLIHEFIDRKYYIQSAISFSKVAGSTDAIFETQTSSNHYFQRPDADHLTLDSTATSLSGYSYKLIAGKSRGHFRGAVGVLASSPGFEVNDLGFGRNSDYFMEFIWLAYREWNPGKYFRNYNININQWANGDFAPEVHSFGGNVNFHGTLLNDMGIGGGINANASGISTNLLRGGPAIYFPANVSAWGSFWTDYRKPLSFDCSASFFRNADDVVSIHFSQGIGLRPINNLQLSLNLSLSDFTDTWAWRGKAWDINDEIHYIFSDLQQKELTLMLRTDYTITTSLSLQYYGQYYATGGKYSNFRETNHLRDSEFNRRFEELEYAVVEYPEDGDPKLLLNDFSGVEYTFSNWLDDDFSYLDFRSNLVLRWEFRPGTTLFVVWSDGYSLWDSGSDPEITYENNFPTYKHLSDMNKLFNTTGDDVLMIKLSYLIHV
ncbi:MAG: DUF5916 domain-containing protein [Fidelibacterota bacterium]